MGKFEIWLCALPDIIVSLCGKLTASSIVAMDY